MWKSALEIKYAIKMMRNVKQNEKLFYICPRWIKFTNP